MGRPESQGYITSLRLACTTWEPVDNKTKLYFLCFFYFIYFLFIYFIFFVSLFSFIFLVAINHFLNPMRKLLYDKGVLCQTSPIFCSLAYSPNQRSSFSLIIYYTETQAGLELASFCLSLLPRFQTSSSMQSLLEGHLSLCLVRVKL